MGRKRLLEDGKVFSIRLSKADMEQVRKIAERDSTHPSTWIRGVVRAALGLTQPATRKERLDWIRQAGDKITIDQIAEQFNISKSMAYSDMLASGRPTQHTRKRQRLDWICQQPNGVAANQVVAQFGVNIWVAYRDLETAKAIGAKVLRKKREIRKSNEHESGTDEV